MKLPTDIEAQYLNEVLSNRSLEDLPDEEWKLIEDFENYAISNYGRIKSLEWVVINSMGGVCKMKDTIKKLRVYKYFNKQLNKDFYTVRGNLCLEGKDYGKSVPVWYTIILSKNPIWKTGHLLYRSKPTTSFMCMPITLKNYPEQARPA